MPNVSQKHGREEREGEGSGRLQARKTAYGRVWARNASNPSAKGNGAEAGARNITLARPKGSSKKIPYSIRDSIELTKEKEAEAETLKFGSKVRVQSDDLLRKKLQPKLPTPRPTAPSSSRIPIPIPHPKSFAQKSSAVVASRKGKEVVRAEKPDMERVERERRERVQREKERKENLEEKRRVEKLKRERAIEKGKKERELQEKKIRERRVEREKAVEKAKREKKEVEKRKEVEKKVRKIIIPKLPLPKQPANKPTVPAPIQRRPNFQERSLQTLKSRQSIKRKREEEEEEAKKKGRMDERAEMERKREEERVKMLGGQAAKGARLDEEKQRARGDPAPSFTTGNSPTKIPRPTPLTAVKEGLPVARRLFRRINVGEYISAPGISRGRREYPISQSPKTPTRGKQPLPPHLTRVRRESEIPMADILAKLREERGREEEEKEKEKEEEEKDEEKRREEDEEAERWSPYSPSDLHRSWV